MSSTAMLMGTDMSYQHNEDYYWLCPLDYCTAVNTYGEPLFSILEQNGYETGAFLSPNDEITRPIYHHLVDGDSGDSINTIWGCSLDRIRLSGSKKENTDSLLEFISENQQKRFAAFAWAFDDHLAFTPGGPKARLSCYKETSTLFGKVIEHLKKMGLYESTDIYVIGDHGDTHYSFSEASHDVEIQHATTPFHTTTHVPLLVKSKYIEKGERYDIVSNIDIYRTVLNSIGIQTKTAVLLEPFASIDLRSKNRTMVVSQNKFVKQLGTSGEGFGLLAGVAITKGDYVFVKNEKGVFLFYYILDHLNVSNLLRGFKEINFNHQQCNNWFDKDLMDTIKNKIIPDFESIMLSFSEKGYVRKDLNNVTPDIF